MDYIFSYILTGMITAAINDIFILPDYAKNHPENSCLCSDIKLRIMLSAVIIFGWLPLIFYTIYQAITYNESDE